MLCHYFFDVLLDRSRISSFFEEKGFIYDELRPAFKNEGTAFTFRKKDFENWLSTDAIKYLEYLINAELPDARIEVSLPDTVDDEITIRYAEELTGLVNNEETYLRLSLASLTTRVKDNGFHEESPFSFIFRFYLIKCIFGDHTSLKDSFVFPPSRGPVLTEEIRPITGMYSKFKDCLYKLKRPVREGEESYRTVAALFSQVLNGTVSYTDGNYVYQTEGTELPISAAAASIRELAPIEQMVKKVDLSKTALLIEEPEAHLHPLKQRMMADITSGMLHTGAFMQVTTHSDYYLRRINELILLNRLSNREDFKAIAEAVNMPMWLYNVPGRTVADLKNDTVLRLAQIPNIVGLKDATGDIARAIDLLRRLPEAVGDKEFAVYSGNGITSFFPLYLNEICPENTGSKNNNESTYGWILLNAFRIR